MDCSLMVPELEASGKKSFSATQGLGCRNVTHTFIGRRGIVKSLDYSYNKRIYNQINLGYVADMIQRHSAHEHAKSLKGPEKSCIQPY